MNEQLLEYFQRELEFLADAGTEFARRHPEIGDQLDATQLETADPHMERMIQAFQLMNARIHLHMDHDLSHLTDAIYSTVFPYTRRPIPSCGVVRMIPSVAAAPQPKRPESGLDDMRANRAHVRLGAPNPDSSPVSGTRGVTIPRGTPLESDPVNGLRCRFRTCYPVSLQPIELHSARLERLAADGAPEFAPQARSVLRMTFRAAAGTRIRIQDLAPLRLFVLAPRQTSYPLYELLIRDSIGISILGGDGVSAEIPGHGLLAGVGFDDAEALLPWPGGSPMGRRLLLEFFSFPDKYLFIDIRGLEQFREAEFEDSVEILVYLNRSSRELEDHVTGDTLQLHCTPVVNLFHQRAEPIPLDHERTAYPVRPDIRFADSLETYSVDRVTALSSDRTVELPALYEPDRGDRSRFQQAVWTSSRVPSGDAPDSGDVLLSVADPQGELLEYDKWTIDVESTCSNGDLPASLPFHGKGPRLRMRGSARAEVECIVAPTRRVPPRLSGAGRDKLVALLALQSLPLLCENPDDSHLQDVLQICNPLRSTEGRATIDGIVQASAKHVLEEIAVGTARCTCHGIEVEIEFDESRYPGGSVFLFGSVLDRFLSMTCSINCFSRLVIRSTETKKVIHRFPARVSDQTLASVS